MAEGFRYVTTRLYQPTIGAVNPIIAELPLTGVTFTNQLNGNGTFNGHLLLTGSNAAVYNAYDGTIPGKTILWVLYSEAVTNTVIPVWSGIIWGRDYDGASQTLTISAQEMMSLYGRRLITTTLDYTDNPSDPLGYDPSYIAKQIIDYAENKPHGRTGLNTTLYVSSTAYRTKQKYNASQYKNVYQAVKDLSASFFDFKISPLVTANGLVNYLHIDDPLGTTYSSTDPYALVFEFPGNLVNYRFPEDATAAVNRLYGFGYQTNNTAYTAEVFDPDKIGSWQIDDASGNGAYISFHIPLGVDYSGITEGMEIIVDGVNPSQYNGIYIVLEVSTLNREIRVAGTASGAYVSGGRILGSWPLLENTASFTDIGETELLQDLTLGQLDATSYPPTTVEIVIPPYIEPLYTSYQVGDQVRLDIKDDYFPSGLRGQILRIMAITVLPGENGPAQVSITLTRQLATGQVT